ncbi:MAG: hypothetical protein Q8Q09_28615 [Deltaproteobacteria bacterium]|nr:hypothetical protein [Deltaproteobacteria bacterium]
MKSETLHPGWSVQIVDDRLIATFVGRLSTADGRSSALEFARCLREQPRHVVWDLGQMRGYEAGAREAWQSQLWPLREQILSISVRGGGPFVRLGANTLAMALGIALKDD